MRRFLRQCDSPLLLTVQFAGNASKKLQNYSIPLYGLLRHSNSCKTAGIQAMPADLKQKSGKMMHFCRNLIMLPLKDRKFLHPSGC